MMTLAASQFTFLPSLNVKRTRSSRQTVISLHCRATIEAPPSFPSSLDPSSIVPRRCTLKELTFSEDGRLVTRPTPVMAAVSKPSELIELFAATVETTAQVKDLETLTGRLAMVAFFAAIVVEYMTGSGVFNSVDQEALRQVLGLGFLTAVGGGSFAVAMKGKRNATDILANGYKAMMDSTVDSLVDGLFSQEGVVIHCAVEDTKKPNN